MPRSIESISVEAKSFCRLMRVLAAPSVAVPAVRHAA